MASTMCGFDIEARCRSVVACTDAGVGGCVGVAGCTGKAASGLCTRFAQTRGPCNSVMAKSDMSGMQPSQRRNDGHDGCCDARVGDGAPAPQKQATRAVTDGGTEAARVALGGVAMRADVPVPPPEAQGCVSDVTPGERTFSCNGMTSCSACPSRASTDAVRSDHRRARRHDERGDGKQEHEHARARPRSRLRRDPAEREHRVCSTP